MESHAAAKGMEAARRASEMVKQDLARAGFIAHKEKSQWTPSQKMQWLGFDLDLEKGIVSVPPHKIWRLQEALTGLGECIYVQAKQIASLVGNIMSISIFLGPVAQLMTRSLYTLLDGRHSWYERLQVSSEAAKNSSFGSSAFQISMARISGIALQPCE